MNESYINERMINNNLSSMCSSLIDNSSIPLFFIDQSSLFYSLFIEFFSLISYSYIFDSISSFSLYYWSSSYTLSSSLFFSLRHIPFFLTDLSNLKQFIVISAVLLIIYLLIIFSFFPTIMFLSKFFFLFLFINHSLG
jgi:hypothetical protein